MGRHQAGRTAGFLPRIGTRTRVSGPEEPRGRLSDEGRPGAPALGIPVSQAMAILERIAERRAEQVGVSLHLADRIRTFPEF